MAFLRWRGNCAQLLASVWRDGRNRQVLVCNFGGAESVAASIRDMVAERHPGIPVDWEAIERELAAGPSGAVGRRDHEAALRTLAARAGDGRLSETEKATLEQAARILKKLAKPH